MAIISPGVWPIDPTVETGTQLATHLNELIAAIETMHANATRPGTIKAGGLWVQTSGASDLALMFFDGTNDHTVATIAGGLFSMSGRTIAVADAQPGIKITQTGTGDAFLVEDAASPDASPFVIRNDGGVGIGVSNPGTQKVLVDVQGGSAFSGVLVQNSNAAAADTAGLIRATIANNTKANLLLNLVNQAGEALKVYGNGGIKLTNSIETAANTEGTAGQVLMSGGPGQPVTWGSGGGPVWVTFERDGRIRAQNGVQTVGRNGVGDFTIYFTRPMPHASYAVSAMAIPTDGDIGTLRGVMGWGPGQVLTTAFRVLFMNGINNALYDPEIGSVVFYA